MEPEGDTFRVGRTSYPPAPIRELNRDKLAAMDLSKGRARALKEQISNRTVSAIHRRGDETQQVVVYFARRIHGELNDLIATVVRMCAAGEERPAMQHLIDDIEESLRRSRTARVDALLNSLDPEQLSPSVTLAVLTITSYAKTDLLSRTGFLARAEKVLESKLGLERARTLLQRRR